MRVLIVDDAGEGSLDLALRAQRDGHKVRLFQRRYDPLKRPVGRGLVELVPHWQDHVDWCDLIILPTCSCYMTQMDTLRQRGVKIIGGGTESASWELDRLKGMQVMRKAGIAIPPYREFRDYREAIRYIEKQACGFASKPCWDEPDKGLTYVGKTADDMIYMLDKWRRKHGRPKGTFILQEVVKGIEFAVGSWFGPGGFAGGWEENFEEKKLMAGGEGPNCYSADTEVLTDKGWKFWPDVVVTDKLATLVNGYMTFEKPSQLVAAPFNGEMITWQSNRLDLVVTPGHQMYVADRQTIRTGEPEFFHIAAHAIAEHPVDKKFAMLRTASWAGETSWKMTPALARLLGMFLADGYVKRRAIQFGNCPIHKEILIREAALAAGYTAHRYGSDVYINSADLANAWRHFPKSPEKRVPDEIMNAPVDVIAAFLDGFALDASRRPNNLIYNTASKGMADDLQVLLMKVGLAGNVRERDRRDEPDRELKGYTIKGSLSWDVGVSSNALAWLRPRYCRRVPYNGMVYCATVSSHVLMVRRNGKACWNGQTGEMGTTIRYVRRSKLADKLLKPLEDQLHRIGYVGCVDVNAIVDEDGNAWPLEFTMRFGWPAWNISQALLKDDPIEFFMALAEGKGGMPFDLDRVAVGVVRAHGDFPHSKIPREEVCGIPIYGLDPEGWSRDGWQAQNVHPAEVMLGKVKRLVDGKLAETEAVVAAGDYLVIATGTGDTVQAARQAAYRVIKRLSIPNSPFSRPDIGLRLAREVPRLQEHGYATGMMFSA